MTPTGSSTLESVRDEIDAMYKLRDESLEFTPPDKGHYRALLAMEARLLRWEPRR